MNFKKFALMRDTITEVLDMEDTSEVVLRWEPELSPNHREEQYKAEFEVDGDHYYVGFKRIEHKKIIDYYVLWDLERARMSWWWVIKSIFTGKWEQFSRTGLGETKGIGYTLKVIKSVFKAIHDFVGMVKPSVIQYDENDPGLQRFYAKAALKIGPKFGYKSHHNMLVRYDAMKKQEVITLMSKV